MRLAELCRLRIALLGYGREGRAALGALRTARPDVDLTVLAESGPLPDDCKTRIGPFDERLHDFEVLIRSPGVPVLHPALKDYRAASGIILNPASIWFSERPDLPVVGITGSKGKSTTASLLAHQLSAAGRKVLLAGNIGVPLLSHLDTAAELVVLELSSYQLTDLEGRLSLGLITRLFPEHGDWHGGVTHYYASKLRMLDLLHGNPLLINAADAILLEQTAQAPNRLLGNRPPLTHRQDDKLYRDGEVLAELEGLHLMGHHNLDNAALATEAARLLGVNLGTAAAALSGFRPLEHRLERVADYPDLCWINDSIATTPHATLAALQALSSQAVVLIAGGYVRPVDWTPVLAHCRRSPLRGLVLLPDSGAEIAAAFEAAGLAAQQPVSQVTSMDQAVREAARLAGQAATILLSPGAASFPYFRDFEHRGASFRDAVAAYYKDRSTA